MDLAFFIRIVAIAVLAATLVAVAGTWTPFSYERFPDNRDLIFSVAAGAFGIWSYIEQRCNGIADADRSAFQDAYGTTVQFALSQLREIFADVDSACGRFTAHEIVDLTRKEFQPKLDRQIRAIHGCYRELYDRYPQSEQLDQALQSALDAEDRLKAALGNLVTAYSADEPTIRSRARSECGDVSRACIGSMQDDLHAVKISPPRRNNKRPKGQDVVKRR